MNLENASTRALLILGAALAAPLPAWAQSYTMTQRTGTFTSISTTGSLMSVSSGTSDDGYGFVSLPFSFNFYGSTYTEVYPSTNGLIAFGTGTTSYSDVPLPSSSVGAGIVAGYWADMELAFGSVYSRTTGSSGSRVVTIEYSNFTPLNGSDTINFQVRLYEATGVIEILYGASTGSGPTGAAGVQDPFGADGAAPSCSSSAIQSSSACSFLDFPSGTLLVFTPGAGPVTGPDLRVGGTTTPPTTVTPGNTYTLEVTVRNDGTSAASGFTVQVASELGGSPVVLGEAFVSSINAGGQTSATVTYTVPLGTPSGAYPLVAIVDAYNDVLESNETNNTFNAGFVSVGGSGQSITISSVSVPPGTVGSPYSFQLQQTGATSPSWSINSGSLPSGLTMSSSGRITGTPSSAGVSTFGVVCEQSGFTPGTRTFQLEITSGTGFRLTSTQLPQGTVGQSYSGRIEATGGQAPYAYQIVSGKPGWLNMSADGSLSGTPDGTGMHELRISVFDSATAFIEGVALLEVVQGGPLVLSTTPADLVAGVVGLPYSVTLRAAGGTQPYNFQVSSGSLPSGLSLDGDSIFGTPTGGGMSSFEIRVSDSAGGSASGSFSISVTERSPLVIDVQNTITVRPMMENDVTLSATGGVPPYTWSIVGGSLPDGLGLSEGHIRGTATSSRATSLVTLRVTDTQGETAEKAVTIEVRKANNNNNNSSGGGGVRRDGGCVCVEPGRSGGPLASLAMLVVGVGLIIRRRRSR